MSICLYAIGVPARGADALQPKPPPLLPGPGPSHLRHDRYICVVIVYMHYMHYMVYNCVYCFDTLHYIPPTVTATGPWCHM
jgi:hypothetical protein